MKRKSLNTLQILICLLTTTVCSGQTDLNNICLTPEQYRFYAGCVIDKQVLVKDTSRLNGAIKDLSFKVVSLESDLEKYRILEAKMGEKETILENSVSKLQDALDVANVKKVRNSRIAIVAITISVLEAAAIGLALSLAH